MYSAHIEGKSVIAERFIRTLENTIYKYITSVLDDIVNKYSNTYHSTIKMKSVDVKSNTYIDSSEESNENNSKFKIDDIVKISKYKNIFAKGCTPNWFEEVFVIKKYCVLGMLLMILIAKKLLEHFTIKNCKKHIKNSLELKK